MSADNGVYICSFKNFDGSKEFRVIHRTNIEDLQYYDPIKELVLYEAELVSSLSDCELIKSESEALNSAHKIYSEIMKSDFLVIEYGISFIDFDHPFPTMSKEDAKKILLEQFNKDYEIHYTEDGHVYHTYRGENK